MTTLRHETTFDAAWDCMLLPSPHCLRHTDCDPNNPAKNYGRCGMRIRHYAIGDAGAVQFVWAPAVYLPETKDFLDSGTLFRSRSITYPDAIDLGWHAPVPDGEPEEGEWPSWGTWFEKCDILGGPCLYDGSSLNARPLLDTLIRRGGEAMWAMLDDYYWETFGRDDPLADLRGVDWEGIAKQMAAPDSEAVIDILVAMLDEYDYRGRNLDFGEYAGRIVATWKDTE